MSVDLRTKYLGMELGCPLVVASCPLTEDLDQLKQLEQSGAAAAVLPSLFEEQIEHEDSELTAAQEYGAEFYAEHSLWYPEMENYGRGPGMYLDSIGQAKRSVGIPIIASLNGTSLGGWTSYAKRMEEAGADAIELNIYLIAADMNITGAEVEQRYLELIQQVKQSVSIPIAVKIGPFFSSLANMARRMVEAGADGLVLFNRFLQPDIDPEALETNPRLELSTDFELLLPVRWIAILHGRIGASLAHTSGIHSADGLIKTLMAGADVGMIASLLYRQGFSQIQRIREQLAGWMEEHDYSSVEQMKGSMSQQNCPDPAAFERGNYMKVLRSYTL